MFYSIISINDIMQTPDNAPQPLTYKCEKSHGVNRIFQGAWEKDKFIVHRIISSNPKDFLPK